MDLLPQATRPDFQWFIPLENELKRIDNFDWYSIYTLLNSIGLYCAIALLEPKEKY